MILEENYEIRGADNVQRQISKLISRQMEAVVLGVLQIFLKIGENHSDIRQF